MIKKTLLAAVLGLAALNASAQFGMRSFNRTANGKFYRSYQVGGHVAFPGTQTVNLTFNYSADHPYASGASNTFTVDTKPQIGYMGEFAFAFNLYRIDEVNAIALTAGLTAFGEAQELIKKYKPNNVSETNLNYINIDYMLPVCLAYKTGGEVSRNKKDRFSFTLGYGIAPTLSAFALQSYGDFYTRISLKTVPVLFSEIGFFAGINMKLKATFYPKGYYKSFQKTIVTGDDYLFGTTTDIKFTSRPAMELGIVIMPFSFKWEDGRW